MLSESVPGSKPSTLGAEAADGCRPGAGQPDRATAAEDGRGGRGSAATRSSYRPTSPTPGLLGRAGRAVAREFGRSTASSTTPSAIPPMDPISTCRSRPLPAGHVNETNVFAPLRLAGRAVRGRARRRQHGSDHHASTRASRILLRSGLPRLASSQGRSRTSPSSLATEPRARGIRVNSGRAVLATPPRTSTAATSTGSRRSRSRHLHEEVCTQAAAPTDLEAARVRPRRSPGRRCSSPATWRRR